MHIYLYTFSFWIGFIWELFRIRYVLWVTYRCCNTEYPISGLYCFNSGHWSLGMLRLIHQDTHPWGIYIGQLCSHTPAITLLLERSYKLSVIQPKYFNIMLHHPQQFSKLNCIVSGLLHDYLVVNLIAVLWFSLRMSLISGTNIILWN